jgi:hypothetical protein
MNAPQVLPRDGHAAGDIVVGAVDVLGLNAMMLRSVLAALPSTAKSTR